MLLLFETAAVLGDVKAVVVVVVVETTAADRNAADINFIISFCSVYIIYCVLVIHEAILFFCAPKLFFQTQ